MPKQDMTPAEQIRADLAARQADIRGRRDLSDEGRTRQLARATADAKKKMKALREKETASIEKRRADLVQRLFGNAKSWDTTATILYRDSQDRAAKLKTPDEATEMMERALMSGDASLARAIAMRATQQALVPMVGDKWAPVVDKWAQSQPDSVGEDIGELADIVQATTKPQHQFARNMSYSVPTPGELSGKDINRLAMDADENPGENEPDLSTGFENPRRRRRGNRFSAPTPRPKPASSAQALAACWHEIRRAPTAVTSSRRGRDRGTLRGTCLHGGPTPSPSPLAYGTGGETRRPTLPGLARTPGADYVPASAGRPT